MTFNPNALDRYITGNYGDNQFDHTTGVVYVEQTITKSWHVDPDELRDAFPNEWAEYTGNGNDHDDDVAWVRYAFDSGCEFAERPVVDDDVAVWQ